MCLRVFKAQVNDKWQNTQDDDDNNDGIENICTQYTPPECRRTSFFRVWAVYLLHVHARAQKAQFSVKAQFAGTFKNAICKLMNMMPSRNKLKLNQNSNAVTHYTICTEVIYRSKHIQRDVKQKMCTHREPRWWTVVRHAPAQRGPVIVFFRVLCALCCVHFLVPPCRHVS